MSPEGSEGAGAGAGAAALEARREEIEALVDAVQGHARTLALLAPELRRRGVAATQAALVELMEQMESQFPGNREKSLFASVELSLRHLSPTIRKRVRVLGVFQGGVNLAVLGEMNGWEQAELVALSQELVATGLATANSYAHLSIDPALCPYLKSTLNAEELEELTDRWLKAMADYLGYLNEQQSQNAELASTLTLLELPNLFALLNQLQATATPEETINRATSLHSLLLPLYKRHLLEHLGRVRDAAVATLGDRWSHAYFEAARTRIEQHQACGQLRKALVEAQKLLMHAQGAGEHAYAEADYDQAMAFSLMARLMRKTGSAEQSLALVRTARSAFKTFAEELPCRGAEEMEIVCLIEEGNCLRDLGRYGEAVALYKDTISRAKDWGAHRHVAIGNFQLGTARLEQGLYEEALAVFSEARERFFRLNEPLSVARCWHQIGRVLLETGQPEGAEDACNHSLAIKVRLGDLAGQGSSLSMIGTLYCDVLERPEEAVVLFRQAAEIYGQIGNTALEGSCRKNMAMSLSKLHRLDEARHAMERAIECDASLGHAAQPWKTWAIIGDIENEAGNTAAAAEARCQSHAAFVLYRLDGGENQFGSGRLAWDLRQCLEAREIAFAVSLLQQLKADPGFTNQLPFLTALQAITAGSRDRSLAEDPALAYDEAAEVLLLIEALQGPEAGAGG